MSEFSIIENFFKKPFAEAEANPSVVVGIGDDAAIINPTKIAADQWVVCVDTLVEGVHFLPGCSADNIAYKALAVNLSDFAAMGATPYWMTLSLTMPKEDRKWVSLFSDSLRQLALEYNLLLIGGDTTRGPLSITIQLMGLVEGADSALPLLRSGAKSGQIIAVSGDIGGASLGLDILQGKVSIRDEVAIERLQRPVPRLALGKLLRRFASSCIDLSDGLVGDLAHLCKASNVGAVIDIEKVPIYSGLLTQQAACQVSAIDEAQVMNAVATALTFGDDYELLFTLDKDKWIPFITALDTLQRSEGEIPVTPIGELTPLNTDIITGVHAGGRLISWRKAGEPYLFEEEVLDAYEHFR